MDIEEQPVVTLERLAHPHPSDRMVAYVCFVVTAFVTATAFFA